MCFWCSTSFTLVSDLITNLLANHSTVAIQPCPVFSQQPGAIFEIFDFLWLKSFTFCAEVFFFLGLFPCDRDKMAAKETRRQVRKQLAAKATDTSIPVFLGLLPCDRDKMAAKKPGDKSGSSLQLKLLKSLFLLVSGILLSIFVFKCC